ncbi:MAG: TlpA disulfide reductase family protein [Planctomycetota bacterium]
MTIAEFRNAADAALGGIDIGVLSPGGAWSLQREGVIDFASRELVVDVYERLSAVAGDAQGDAFVRSLAMACASALVLAGPYDPGYEPPAGVRDEQAAFASAFAVSDGRDAVLRSRFADAGVRAVLFGGPDTIDAEGMEALLDGLDAEPDPAAAVVANELWDVARSVASRSDDAASAELRERVRVLAQGWMERAAALGGESAEFYTTSAQRLDSLDARGLLIDHPAPELEIAWCSDPAITSLEDLRGRVVVLDFWATWCGPCVETFPDLRELRASYPEDALAIVGVTSPQSMIVNLSDTQPMVDCTGGGPEMEIGLMPTYMEHHDMTWPVAMLEGDRMALFHPDYGVRGIPHVVIIDARGDVRYNGLHPTDPTKREKIDALLEEAGVGAPVR